MSECEYFVPFEFPAQGACNAGRYAWSRRGRLGELTDGARSFFSSVHRFWTRRVVGWQESDLTYHKDRRNIKTGWDAGVQMQQGGQDEYDGTKRSQQDAGEEE